MTMKLEIEKVSNCISTASGGTRTGIKFSRPWQTDIVVDPAVCPFETKEEAEIPGFRKEHGWRFLGNKYTPFPFHRLIVPETCWPKERLRVLGGEDEIGSAFRIVQDVLLGEARELWLGIHIGPSAGQNIAHAHYHLLEPLERMWPELQGDITVHFKDSPNVLFKGSQLRAVVGGCRSGQCFIVPENDSMTLTSETAREIASLLSRIINLYSKKFKSTQGLPPDYIVGFKFSGLKVQYGFYIPILHNWGFVEYFGMLEGTPFILPWSHKETLGHLIS